MKGAEKMVLPFPSVRSIAALLFFGVGLITLGVQEPIPVKQLRALGFDLFQGVSPSLDEKTDFAVVRIGEESIAQVGPWPWRRDKIAAIVDRARELGATAVVVNLIMDSPDRFSRRSLAEELGRADNSQSPAALLEALAKVPEADALLAESLRTLPSALATSVTATPPSDPQRKVSPAAIPLKAALLKDTPRFADVIAPFAPLREAARAEGAINLLPEHDMVLRRSPLFFVVDDVFHPALPVAALVAAGREIAVASNGRGENALTVDGQIRASDSAGVIWLDFGRAEKIPVFEAMDLGDEAKSEIEGRVVVLGLDAVGLSTTWHLADGRLVSGTEVVAIVADALDAGSTLSRSGVAETAEFALMLGGATVIAAAWLRLAPVLAFATSVAIAAGWLGMVLVARSQAGVVFDAISPIAFWTLLAAVATAIRSAALWRARAELIAALEMRTAAAEAANEAKTRFLREMHHDIRTPLNAVIGFSSLLSLNPNRIVTTAKASEFGAAIKSAGELILGLSERALQAAELSTEHARPEPKPIEVGDVIKDAAQIIRGNRQHTTALEVLVDEPPLIVFADRTYFLEAVLNLLENAFKHAKGTDSVVLSARRTGSAEVAIEVIDTGPGVSEEILENIGTPFMPGRSAQGGTRGTGLGLYIVKRFVDLHGGRLTLENRQAGGLCSRIELALRDDESAPH